MIGLIRVPRPVIRYAIGVVMCACIIFPAFSLIGNARQVPSITDGVYSAPQAERAVTIYRAQCAECHGNALEGASTGSPLTGDGFLANWSGRPLADLVDKIENTMPFNTPGSLTRQESTDLTAYILQAGDFPAGQADLGEDMLALITLPTVAISAESAAAFSATSLPPPRGNLAELMRAIAFPNSNVIFNLQVKDPTDAPTKGMPIPFDYFEWGLTVYPGWLSVDQAAVALTETAPLLLTPGRRCQNGLPVPVDRADWKQYVADLVDVGDVIYQASKARDYEALVALNGRLNDACGNCHAVYRDGGGAEGSGENRCVIEP
jgi:cytochrome c5